MRVLYWSFTLILLFDVTHNKKPLKSKHSKGIRRKTIIKCCGVKRCSPSVMKTRPMNNTPTALDQESKANRLPTTLLVSPVETTGNWVDNDVTKSTTVEAMMTQDSVSPTESVETTGRSEIITTQKTGLSSKSTVLPLVTTSSAMTAKLNTSPSSTTSSEITSTNPSTTTSTKAPTTTTAATTTTSTTTTTTTTPKPAATTIATTMIKTTTTTTTTTPPTTTTPKCILSCTDFNNYMERTPSIKPSSSDGSVQGVSTCQKKYYISSVTAPRNEAALRCKSMKMALLAVTSIVELECLSSVKEGTYWTSGSNEDENCNLAKKYSWCSTGSDISTSLTSSSKFWLPTNAVPSSLERCLAVVTFQKGLVHRKCDEVLPYICQFEVDCPKTCAKNDSLFDLDGNLKRKNSYGYWTDVGSYTYLFGTKLMTWDGTWSQCCALGMRTLTIENAEEQAGLSNLTVLLKDNWPINYNYWTSGTWKGAPEGQWSWCESAGTSTLDQSLKWESGQPDNLGGSEQCIHFSFAMNSSQAVLTDRNCSNRYIYACKMPLIVTPKPCVVACPKSCQRDASLFTPDDQLINFASYGEWFNGCGRNYLFYNKMRMNWASAWATCCSFRMSLSFLDTSDKLQCISNIITKFSPFTVGDFWLSGTASGCNANFHWCFLDFDFNNKDLKWKEGHPVAGLDCVYLEARNESVLLATADCNEQKQFLCDVQKRGQSQVAKLNECLETWQVNDGELYMLMDPNLMQKTNITRRQKCFLRCIGNMFGLMGFGDVNSIALLRQVELATQGGPQKMEDGLKVQDECGGKNFDDECVTAFEIYKCGQEKAPDMVFNMVSNNFGTGPVVEPPVPRVPVWRTCWLTKSGLPCVSDQTAINALNSNNQDSFGKKIPFLGKTYYVAFDNVSRDTVKLPI
ncbi:Hypothetical predicted protein [Cloeon dipterum]|uniref:C-type lectin domain-containing protein n=1 Tax=Cloeon dipterum TaxID=197152 RepID=A0A8S1BXR1_9INSE|nr:Hypothetical predicted protein [Cloeon dipterum]